MKPEIKATVGIAAAAVLLVSMQSVATAKIGSADRYRANQIEQIVLAPANGEVAPATELAVGYVDGSMLIGGVQFMTLRHPTPMSLRSPTPISLLNPRPCNP
jgi:hypothetical protein